MSAVPEDVVTSDQIAKTASDANPETQAAGAAPVAEANGATPTAVVPTPASTSASTPKSASASSEKQSDFESMFKELSEGDVVVGTVVHIDKDGVLVDVGSKSEGIIRPNELSKEPYENMSDVVTVGETVKVVVIGRDREDGNLLLSKKRADFEKAWDKVIEAMHDGTVLHAMVTERVKGGLTVDLGIRGFVPASHVGSGDFKHQNLDKYVGQSVPLKVIEVDRERHKVILSHKMATIEEREQRKTQTLSALKEGDVRKGIVRRVTDYGAFIDLGGIDGLLHVSEMSWARIKHPSEVVKNGQEIDVMILKLRPDQDRISLGLRQILPDPWADVAGKYNVGDVVKVPISRLVPFGAFVTLENGVEAIIPNSELSDRRISKPSDVVNPGDEVEARIVEMRPEERKMTLSIRRMTEAPAGAPPREPYVPEPEGAGRGRGRDRDRDDRDDRGGSPAAPAAGGARPEQRRPRRENRYREAMYNSDPEDDYKEFKNYRANQREETFGTSLADVFGDHFNALRGEDSAESSESTDSNTESAGSEEKSE